MTPRSEAIGAVAQTYLAVFEPVDEGGYVVSFPSFSGLITQGETRDETRAAATDLLGGYLGLMRERGRSLPASDGHVMPIRGLLAG